MRIVLDSSVLIAAVAHPGVCTQLLEEVIQEHDWVSSDFILSEVSRKLREKFKFAVADAAAIVTLLRQQSEQVQPASIPVPTCRDPEDLPILGTAVAGHANYLITVDKDLLSLLEFQGIQIVRPGEFWKRTRGRQNG